MGLGADDDAPLVDPVKFRPGLYLKLLPGYRVHHFRHAQADVGAALVELVQDLLVSRARLAAKMTSSLVRLAFILLPIQYFPDFLR